MLIPMSLYSKVLSFTYQVRISNMNRVNNQSYSQKKGRTLWRLLLYDGLNVKYDFMLSTKWYIYYIVHLTLTPRMHSTVSWLISDCLFSSWCTHVEQIHLSYGRMCKIFLESRSLSVWKVSHIRPISVIWLNIHFRISQTQSHSQWFRPQSQSVCLSTLSVCETVSVTVRHSQCHCDWVIESPQTPVTTTVAWHYTPLCVYKLILHRTGYSHFLQVLLVFSVCVGQCADVSTDTSCCCKFNWQCCCCCCGLNFYFFSPTRWCRVTSLLCNW